MAPINPIELLKQMHDEYEVREDANELTEDMRDFEMTRIMVFATETRSTHPEETDKFMKSNGYGWNDNPEYGDIGYFW